MFLFDFIMDNKIWDLRAIINFLMNFNKKIIKFTFKNNFKVHSVYFCYKYSNFSRAELNKLFVKN